MKIDSEQHNSIIVADIDDTTLVIKDSMLQDLKIRLEDVSLLSFWHSLRVLVHESLLICML